MYQAPSSGNATSSILPIATAAFAIAIFIADTVTDRGIAVAVLYVAVVLMAARFCPARGVLLVSLGCVGVTVVSFFLSPGSGRLWIGVINVCLSISAIEFTTFVVLKGQSAEAALREQANLLDLTHDSVFSRGMDGAITYWNRGAEVLYGWKRAEALGKLAHQLLEKSYSAPLAEVNAELLRTGRWEGELVCKKRDGTPVVVASRWSLQRDQQGQPAAILETNNDITERKRAGRLLSESERRYRQIFNTVGVSIWEKDYSKVNAAIDDLKTQGVEDFRHYLASHPAFVQQAIALVKIIDVNDVTLEMFGARSKDQLLVSLDKIFLSETHEAFMGALLAIAEGRSSFESETKLQTLSGAKLVVLFTITFPPNSATLDNVLLSITDITQRRQAQEALQQAQANLERFNRVMLVGEMTATIAHEVNQPITAVVANAGACLRWLVARPPDLEEARQALGRIVRDGNRASEVIGRIRALVKKVPPRLDRLDINETIREVIALIDGELQRNRVKLQTYLARDLPLVPADRVQLQQVILNLVVNAIEAQSGLDDRPRELAVASGASDASEIFVEVRDSGLGLDPANLDSLFASFYTTKRDGMGMGLAISRSIVESHGGRLWATPNAPHGAVFRFTLPIEEDSPTDPVLSPS